MVERRSRSVDMASMIAAALALGAAAGCEPSVEKGSALDDGDDYADDGDCPASSTYMIEIDEVPVGEQQLEALSTYSPTWFSNTEWPELEEDERCFLACIQAEGILEDGPDGQLFHDVVLESCSWASPDADADGFVSCVGVRDSGITCLGRRPLGWASSVDRPHLDCAVVLEHVSVAAFEELALQLRRFGAPVELVERCLSAAEDERRHVELLVSLGAVRPEGSPSLSTESSALEVALHNAVEGCVAETWAALVAAHQARHAPNDEMRRAHEVIAGDEARHAQLAWDLHDWLCAQLDPTAWAWVEDARREALLGLPRRARRAAHEVPALERRRLGLAGPATAEAMARRFSGDLLRAA